MNAELTVAELWAQVTPASRELLCRVARVAGVLGRSVYLVGGSVRDLLLGGDPTDLDLVTEGDAQALAEAVARDLGGLARSPSQFLTSIVELPDGRHLDVATARQETYPEPTKLPVVAPADLTADLWRRDFSINATALRLATDGAVELVDPTGGRADLAARVLRVLHDRSFADDPTRLLRAVRFEGRLGLRIEDRTRALLAEAVEAGWLDRVTGARVCQEVVKLLAEPRPAEVLQRLEDLGALGSVLPGCRFDARARSRLERAPLAIAALRGARPAAMPEWPCLLGVLTAEGDAEAVVQRLRLSGAAAGAVRAAREATCGRLPWALIGPSAGRASGWRRALEGREFAGLVVLWLRSGATGRRRLEQCAAEARSTAGALNGHDLEAAGIPPGPATRVGLQAVREARWSGRTGRDEQLRAARAAIAEWRRPARRSQRKG